MRAMLLLAISLFCTTLWAQGTAPASSPWTLKDQFDQAFTLDAKTRVLIIARSFSSARLVNSAIEDRPKGFLEDRGVAFVADIEMMPTIAKAVMVPAMRSASYRILLDRDGSVASRYAGDRDTVQWLELGPDGVAREQRFNDIGSLRQALAGLAYR
ncbi:hypothetical protein G7009_20495 [Pseudomonas capeferrum]|uniref:hypothetical protein n=1 Tax=Pseudomonas capeferrum TaxID=1495066 RepID=UPI0015E323DF|nr:hypothetical protein [Pseudomonas capeferrum]MBA1204104.1 hypothetical protein [Pseudomonas capeferrum]